MSGRVIDPRGQTRTTTFLSERRGHEFEREGHMSWWDRGNSINGIHTVLIHLLTKIFF